MTRKQRLRLGLIILLLAPFVVPAVLAAYVRMVNSRPQTGEQ